MKEAGKGIALEDFGYKQELNRVLKFNDLVVYGLIFMVPIAPFGIYGYVADISKGMVALAYLIGMSGMIFTAFSYWRMSEAYPISGSVYAYTTRALGKAVGFRLSQAKPLSLISFCSLFNLEACFASIP